MTQTDQATQTKKPYILVIFGDNIGQRAQFGRNGIQDA
jgi:hypothetical protein